MMNEEMSPAGAGESRVEPTGAEEPEEQVPFAVRDRRHWAREEAEGSEGEAAPRKLAYVEELEKKLEAAETRRSETLTRHKAALEEFENAKARMRRELNKEVEGHKRAVLLELLEVLDNLDRAHTAAEDKPDVAALLAGVGMVRDQFLAKLNSFSVTRLTCQGEPFDPEFHEAVSAVPVTDPGSDGRIVGVVKDGYLIGDEVLRPATVAVGRLQESQA